MQADAGGPAGPDLEAGIRSDTLVDGVPLLGFVGAAVVVLTRIDQGFAAVGATCAHHGGPSAEEPTCWHVEERDGTVRVSRKCAGGGAGVAP